MRIAKLPTNASFLEKLAGIPSKLVLKARELGPVGMIQWILYQFTRRWQEWRLGLRTGQFDLGVEQAEEGENNAYEPVDYRCFEIIMNSVEIIPNESVFFDYGCGKGRAVILAALRPFKRVIGLELSSALSSIAREHVERARGKISAGEVDIITADAQTFSLPDEVTHIFLFNPFVGEVMEAALGQIRSSLRRRDRVLTICYVVPKSGTNWLESQNWLEKEKTLPTGLWTIVDSFVYKSKPVNHLE